MTLCFNEEGKFIDASIGFYKNSKVSNFIWSLNFLTLALFNVMSFGSHLQAKSIQLHLAFKWETQVNELLTFLKSFNGSTQCKRGIYLIPFCILQVLLLKRNN